jgi:hypothetical protein
MRRGCGAETARTYRLLRSGVKFGKLTVVTELARLGSKKMRFRDEGARHQPFSRLGAPEAYLRLTRNGRNGIFSAALNLLTRVGLIHHLSMKSN